MLLNAITLAWFAAAMTAAAPGQDSPTIRVRAWIDGRSQLILAGDTAQWQHFDYAAPGRLNCNLGSPPQATYVDLVEWWPLWPDVPDCENRDCDGCTSDVVGGLPQPIPQLAQTALVIPISVRGTCSVIESPSAMNGYRVVVEFDDNPPGGADWYEIDLALGPAGGEPYCLSTTNSSGLAATLTCSGSLSVAANDTYLIAQGCPPQRIGIFFYGAEPMQAPLANGYLCVNPFHSNGLFLISPAAVAGSGGEAQVHLDFAALPTGGTISGGSTWYFQYWFRDPPAGGAGSNLTNGLKVTFGS